MIVSKKMLAKSSGLETIRANDIIKVSVDYCLINDGVSHKCIDYMQDDDLLYNNNKVIVAIDHDTPSGSVEASRIQNKLINFSKKYNTPLYNGQGIGYQLMIDNYLIEGQVVVSSGLHVSTMGASGALNFNLSYDKLYEVLKTGTVEIKVPEFVKIELTGVLAKEADGKDIILYIIKNIDKCWTKGKIVEFYISESTNLSADDKVTLCNLSSEIGAMATVISFEKSNDDEYNYTYKVDLSKISSMIVFPDNFNYIKNVVNLEEIKINEVFIGGCAGGGIEDLRKAAYIVKGKKVARTVRLMIAPKTSNVYIQALKEGLINDFLEAGAIVMNQGCSTCYGKSQGIIDPDEVLVSTGSYNCKGCAGAESAKIYITSAKVAAISAIKGTLSKGYKWERNLC